MNLAPIFTRDLCTRRRMHKLRQDRFRIGWMLGVVFLAWMIFDWSVGGARLTRLALGMPLMAVAPFVLFLLGLTLGGRLLALEWREGTMPLLLLTRLTGHDIVLGKLFQAMVELAYLLLVTVPILVLPFLAAGMPLRTVGVFSLACANIVFYGMTLRLLISALGDGRRLKEWCMVALAPIFAFATPLGGFIPPGAVRSLLSFFQWLNPCEALAHASTAMGGFQPGAFWWPLLTSHLVAWALAGAAGLVLPAACRWRAGSNLGTSGRAGRRRFALWPERSLAWRARMLDRNPWEWRASRERSPTVHVWLWFGLSLAAFGWLSWVARGVGLPVYCGMAIGVAAVWHIVLGAVVPGEATRHLVEDRQSGMLELVLGTPLGPERLVRGQWKSLRHRYLKPMLAAMLMSTTLMCLGYALDGFGGMLTPADLGQWTFWWLANICGLPLILVTLVWVALRRTLIAQRAGDAAGLAVMQVHAIPIGVLVGLYWAAYAVGVRLSWWWAASCLSAAYVGTLVFLAWRARRIFLSCLRKAAGGSAFFEAETNFETPNTKHPTADKLQVPSPKLQW